MTNAAQLIEITEVYWAEPIGKGGWKASGGDFHWAINTEAYQERCLENGKRKTMQVSVIHNQRLFSLQYTVQATAVVDSVPKFISLQSEAH